MPTKGSVPGHGNTLFGVFQNDVAKFLKNIRLGAHLIFQEATDNFLRGYHGVQNVAFIHLTRSVSEIVTPGRLDRQPVPLEPQPIHNQELAVTSPEPVVPARCNHNNDFPSETDDLEEARRPAADGEHGSNEALCTCSKYKRTRMVVVVLGILFLIIVPGLILGIMTKEIPVGIALSGAIATVASLISGIYYYHKK